MPTDAEIAVSIEKFLSWPPIHRTFKEVHDSLCHHLRNDLLSPPISLKEEQIAPALLALKGLGRITISDEGIRIVGKELSAADIFMANARKDQTKTYKIYRQWLLDNGIKLEKILTMTFDQQRSESIRIASKQA